MNKFFLKSEIDIIVDALLHEMQRYNEAIRMISDRNALKALETAKNDVYRVFTKVNMFTTDEPEKPEEPKKPEKRFCAICGKELSEKAIVWDGTDAFCNEDCAAKAFDGDYDCVEILLDEGRLKWEQI